MKYQSSITKLVFDFDFDLDTKKRYSCPECSSHSKRKNPKDIQYYPSTKIAYCHKCQSTFFEYKQFERKQEYLIPEWKNITDLSDKAVKWFTGRMISQSTLIKMKVYTTNEFMPQFNKIMHVICFPFFVGEKCLNIKFRGAQKSFKLVSGAELVWYNFNALKNFKEIIICEGEIDALTWIENGFENVISVPNGASGKLEFLDNSIDLFEDIEKFYLSTDNDTAGIKLRDELIRRLGAEKCHLLNFKQYKDANDYFVGYGGIELKNLIKEAIPVPIKGIINIDSLYSEIFDLYENGIKNGLEINNPEIDKYMTIELGRLMIVGGIPGSGKSEFIDYLVSRLNLIYGWKSAFFTPENYPLKYHYRKIHEKFSGRSFDKKTDTTDFLSIFEYIKDNYFYILDEDDMTVETIMKSAKMLVKQKGIKILVLDPYNKLEHQYKSNVSETQYISKFLDTLSNFAKFNNVLVILVAHPRKMQIGAVPTLYDISGSANFYNKADYGITIHRDKNDNGSMSNAVDLHVQKIKFKHLGVQGVAELNYNYNNGRFESRNHGINCWDNSNWLDLNQNKTDFKTGIEPDYLFEQIDEIPF